MNGKGDSTNVNRWNSAKQWFSENRYMVVAIVLVVLMLGSITLIGMNLRVYEREVEMERQQLAEKIAKTVNTFLLYQEDHYFYDVLKLMNEIPYVERILIYIEGTLKHNIGENQKKDYTVLEAKVAAKQPGAWHTKDSLYYTLQPLTYESGRVAWMAVVFSTAEIEKPKKAILASIAMIFILMMLLYVVIMRLKTKEEMVQTLFHTIGHEMSGYLNNIEPGDVESTTKTGYVLKRNITLLKEMVKDFRERDLKNIEFHQELIQLNDLIQEIVEDDAYDLDRKNIHVAITPLEKPVIIHSDKTRIRQVIRNVVKNAIKYSPDETEIKIELIPLADSVKIVVRDQGAGVPKKYHKQIFKLFFRVHGKEYKGSGIGLYLSKFLIEKLGGTMGVLESCVDVGTAFYICIPYESPLP
jgi:signal transduction histidine kinase